MKFVRHKAFWNYEKEERWLNEQAANGFALVDYSWCRYVFEESSPGEYIYRIELLQNAATHFESQRYIRFMEESGVEHVASYMRWVYFRRKSAEGAFDIYSDIDSRIQHYRRVFHLWATLAVLELLVGLVNIVLGIINTRMGFFESFFNFNVIVGSITLLVGIALMVLTVRAGCRIARLKRERMLGE